MTIEQNQQNDENLTNLTHWRQVSLSYDGLPVPLFTASMLGLILAYLVKNDVPVSWLIVWLTSFFLVMSFRVFSYFHFRKKRELDNDPEPWRLRFRLGAILLAICWMIAIVVFIPAMSVVNQAVANVLIAGVVAGAISSLSYDLTTVRSYIVIILCPLIIVMGMADNGLNTIALMGAIFMGAMLLGSKRFNEAFVNNIKMQQESIKTNKYVEESDRRIELLIENSPLAIVEWDEQMLIRRWNQASYRYFGLTREQAIDNSILELFEYRNKQVFKKFCFDLLSPQQEAFCKQIDCRTQDGYVIKTNWFASVVKLEDGSYLFAAQIEDVTEQESLRIQQLRRQQQYENLLRNAPVVIYTCRPDGDYGVTYISENVRDSFGFEPQQFINDSSFWKNNIHPDDRGRVFANLGKLFDNRIYSHEYRFRLNNGEYVWVHDELKLVLDEKGAAREIAGYWTNIDTQKQSQLDLERFKSTLDMILDGVFIFDAETLKFIYVNKGATEQLGYSKRELLEMTPVSISPSYDEKTYYEMIDSLQQKHDGMISFETTHKHRNGSQIPVEIALQFVDLPNERGRYVAIVRDISERKKMDAMKDEFISMVSHELRTPLTSIHGAIALLRHSVDTGVCNIQDVSKFVNMAYNNSIRLKSLVNDIIDINRISQGEFEIRSRPVNVLELVKSSIKENEGFAAQYKVNYQFDSEIDEKQTIDVDPVRMHQILSNLLSNAAKFTEKGDSIIVKVMRKGAMIEISVTDHGRGVPQDVGDRIFERFTRGDLSTTRGSGGSGLGLSICKNLVDRMNGEIFFLQNKDEPGTTFYLKFPA